MHETVTQGRAKRATAGNRMRELLEKAHQEEEKGDEIFAEDPEDVDFVEPVVQRDVFLDEFADTDDEVEDEDEEALEKRLRREERKAKKNKNKAFNPLVKVRAPPGAEPSMPSADELALLDPSIDVSKMAPSTLLLEIRRKRREAKRAQRSDVRRSNLRASTLKTEEQIIEKEKAEKIEKQSSRMGRKAQHISGEVRGSRPMTQAELIAAALEEEERNKEALTQWLRREEERRELRRVGRKRVKGPRWTFVSRTVGKLVEVVDDKEGQGAVAKMSSETPAETPALPETPADLPLSPSKTSAEETPDRPDSISNETPAPTEGVTDTAPIAVSSPSVPPPSEVVEASPAGPTHTNASIEPEASLRAAPPSGPVTAESAPAQVDSANTENVSKAEVPLAPVPVPDTAHPSTTQSTAGPSALPQPHPTTGTTEPIPPHPTPGPKTEPEPAQPTAGPSAAPAPRPNSEADPAHPHDTPQDSSQTPYERNYLILSQIPGGLPAELRLILGDHVDWTGVKVIPARNRPINRKRPMDPISGLPAKYRHPDSMIPYSGVESYRTLQAVLDNRFVWTGGWWGGGEADAFAEGIEDIPGWREAVCRGWLGGKKVEEEVEVQQEEEEEPEVKIEVQSKRKAKAPSRGGKRRKR